MKRHIPIILTAFILIIGFQVSLRADSKITALTENTDPQLTDILYWIDDPGGTPASNKIAWGTLLDDTKGNGDTAYVWSADKIYDQLALYVPLSAFTQDGGVLVGTGVGAYEEQVLNSGTDITADLEEETHASEHNDGGADEIDRGTEGVTIVTITDQDATPDVSNGGTEIHRLFKTANTVLTTITDFDDGDDHSEFSDGDWFVLRVLDAYTKIDFSDNANIEGNVNTDWTGSATEVLDLLFRWDNANTRWVCQNLNSGFSDPTTLAIGKAQFDWTIANPQNILNFDTDDTDYTLGTEITSSIVYVDSINDGDADSIDLQDGGSGYDGTLLIIKSRNDIDEDDSFTVDVETDSTCADCPLAGMFTMYDVGAVLSLRWDEANSAWQFENFYQPPFDYASVTTLNGFSGTPTKEIYVSVQNNIVSVSGYISGTNDSAAINLTVPYTSKNSSNSMAFFGEGSALDDATTTFLKVWLNENSSQINFQPSYTDSAWDADATVTIKFTLLYPID